MAALMSKLKLQQRSMNRIRAEHQFGPFFVAAEALDAACRFTDLFQRRASAA